MKIQYDYQVFSTQVFGGISRYFVEMASRISQYPGANVSICAPIFVNRLLAARRDEISIVGVCQRRPIPHTGRIIRILNALVFRVYTAFSKPDIVHETFYWPSRTASHSSKIVLTVYDMIAERLPEHFPRIAEERKLKKSALSRADHVICVSESTRNDLRNLYEVDPDKVSVVYLASSLRRSDLPPVDLGRPFILYVGGRYSYKNFLSLLEAFGTSQLHRTHKLVCFGGGKLSPEELNSIDRNGIPRGSVVQTEGDDTLLGRYYSAADAFVYPSLYEGFGIPLLEAMECGCPVVCSDSSSFPEVAGNAAIYFDPKDVTSIARALIEVTQSPKKRSLMISESKARLEQFSWERCAEQTYSIYQQLLSPS